MNKSEKATKYLSGNRLHHMDMLEALTRDNADVLYAEDDGVLLYNRSGEVYLLSAESDAGFDALCGLIRDPDQLVTHQTRYMPALRERFGLKGEMTCFQCVYEGGTPLPVELPEGFTLRALTQENLDFVLAHYEQVPDPEYISGRIRDGMLGAFRGETPAGFIGTHDEGSMGLLEVLPEYRRRGLAQALESAMIDRLLEKGQTPYGQLFTTNEVSRALQQKLGLSVTTEQLAWLFKD